jgi:hypothetical protein
MRAGAASGDITPPIGASLAGYLEERRATGVHDPLRAKALVVESGDDAVAIVACDAIALARGSVQEIRAIAHDQCGISAQNIMVACTHTHLGPATVDIFQTVSDNSTLERSVEGASGAIAQAKSALRPANVCLSRGELHGIAFNRRYHMADGTIRTNPRARSDIIGPVGPVDPEVIVLSFTSENGEPIAVLVNFALHLDTIGGTMISADYPAVMSEVVQRELGEDAQVIFVNGACGDINHINFMNPADPVSGFERSRAIGEALGRKVLELLPQSTPVEGRIRARNTTVQLQIRSISRQEVEKAQETLPDAPPIGETSTEQVWACETVQVSKLPPSVEAEIQALTLGDCALVGIPCEIFAQLGLEIKRRSPFPTTGIVELANGYEGYLPTRQAYDEGGYEVRAARSSKLASGSGESAVDAAADLLHSLSGDRRSTGGHAT